MSDALLKLYHRLPPPLRSLAASARGYQLKRWRYGPSTGHLVEEALLRESWPLEKWERWQGERLAQMLHRAATRVPYYRENWAARRRAGDNASWSDLANWPIINKEPLRANPAAFVADDHNVRDLFRDQTSGTSGKPLEIWFERDAVRRWYGLFEARLRAWNDVSRHDHWAILGGQLVVPGSVRKPPFWVWNAPMRQLYLSSCHLARENALAYVRALQRYKVTHLLGYSSSLATLSRDVLDLGLEVNGLRVVLTNAEPLSPWQRELIEKAFNARVRETYGMAEAVAGASECSAGHLHLWPEAGCLEVVEDHSDTPVKNGTVGRFVCTGLINDAMPLIRYAVGDRGSVEQNNVCGCGRRLPIISKIEGRTNDMITTPDGRRVYWLNSVFYGLPLAEAQIVHEKPDFVRVKLVPGNGFNKGAVALLIQRLKMRLGDVTIVVEPVTRIPRSANGKFQAVISQVPQEAIQSRQVLS